MSDGWKIVKHKSPGGYVRFRSVAPGCDDAVHDTSLCLCQDHPNWSFADAYVFAEGHSLTDPTCPTCAEAIAFAKSFDAPYIWDEVTCPVRYGPNLLTELQESAA